MDAIEEYEPHVSFDLLEEFGCRIVSVYKIQLRYHFYRQGWFQKSPLIR